MEQITGCDQDGVSCPSGEGFILWFELEHFSRDFLQKLSDKFGCDEAAFALVTSVGGSEHGERLFVW